MSGEMIAIITAAIALAAVLVPGQRGIRRDIQQLSARIGALEGRADAADKRFEPGLASLDTGIACQGFL